MRVDVLRKGRTFFHGGKLTIVESRPVWMSTSIVIAANFAREEDQVWRLRLTRDIRVLRFDGDGDFIELANLVGVEPDDDSLFEAAKAFCKLRPFDAEGWHLPSFYGERSSDTLLCHGEGIVKDGTLDEGQVDRAFNRSKW